VAAVAATGVWLRAKGATILAYGEERVSSPGFGVAAGVTVVGKVKGQEATVEVVGVAAMQVLGAEAIAGTVGVMEDDKGVAEEESVNVVGARGF